MLFVFLHVFYSFIFQCFPCIFRRIQDIASGSGLRRSLTSSETSDDSDSGAEIQIRLPYPSSNRRLRFRRLISTISWPFWTLWLHVHDAWWHFSQLWPEEVRHAVAFFVGWWILRPPSWSTTRCSLSLLLRSFGFWRNPSSPLPPLHHHHQSLRFDPISSDFTSSFTLSTGYFGEFLCVWTLTAGIELPLAFRISSLFSDGVSNNFLNSSVFCDF